MFCICQGRGLSEEVHSKDAEGVYISAAKPSVGIDKGENADEDPLRLVDSI